MGPLLIGLAVGATIGVVGTLIIAVDPLRRERQVWRDRIIREQMRTFAAEARLTAHLYRNRGDGTPVDANVVPIRVVPEPLI